MGAASGDKQGWNSAVSLSASGQETVSALSGNTETAPLDELANS